MVILAVGSIAKLRASCKHASAVGRVTRLVNKHPYVFISIISTVLESGESGRSNDEPNSIPVYREMGSRQTKGQ